MGNYKIVTDATCDIDYSLLKNEDLEIIDMNLEIGGNQYSFGPNGNINIENFYALQRNGNYASTSQINPNTYHKIFKKYLKEGLDIIYLCFSSGMSGTIQSANIAKMELEDEFEGKNIIIVDTLCASVGQGLLIFESLKKQKEGLSIIELEQWVLENRLKVCHWFSVDVFDHLQHGGRVSGTQAIVGGLLQIKPILYVDEEGKLIVTDKPRGQKKAIKTLINNMKETYDPSISNTIFIGHGDDIEKANALKEVILENFEDVEIYTNYIGPIIGSHTGPGMLALIFWGNTRHKTN